MTTYTTPHLATGNSDLRSEPSRIRPASAGARRTAGVPHETAGMREGPTPDWQPGASKGVPKAAIGALGAALVGGVALAIVLMAPSNKVAPRHAQPDPIAEARSGNAAATPPANVQAAATQQTPDTPKVTPSVPATAAPATPDTPAQTPAPAR